MIGRPPRRRSVGGLLASLLGCLAAGAPRAGHAADRRALDAATEAKKACASDQPQRGIELLAEYYARTGDLTAIYNQGRCYEQNDMPEKAISRFREYLRSARDITPARRRETERHIAELEAEVAQKTARAAPVVTPPEPPPPVLAQPPPPVQPPVAAPPVEIKPAPPPPRPEPLVLTETPAVRQAGGTGWRVAGLTLGAVALAGAGAGIYFTTRVRSLEKDAERYGADGPAPYADVDATLSQGRRAQTLQWIGYGTAAGAAAGAVICLLLSKPAAEVANAQASARPLFVPVLDGARVGAAMQLSF